MLGKSSVDTRAMDRLPVAMVLTDPHQDNNPIVYVNDAFTQITGYGRDVAMGRNCRFLQGDLDVRPAAAELRRGIDAGESVSVDIENVRADGSVFTNSLLVAPIRDPGGEIEFFLGIQSEKKIAADAPAENQVAALRERLLELQHRVKNHLSLVLGLIRAQSDTLPDTRTIELLASRVETLALLYDYLDYDTGADIETVPLGAYLSRVCSATQSLSSNIAIRISTDFVERDADMETAAQLGFILSELLTNALTHAFAEGASGEVSMSLSATVGGVELRVADDGRGMGASHWPDSGSLGGQIVRGLCDRLGAELAVKSSESGTAITVTVPLEASAGHETASRLLAGRDA